MSEEESLSTCLPVSLGCLGDGIRSCGQGLSDASTLTHERAPDSCTIGHSSPSSEGSYSQCLLPPFLGTLPHFDPEICHDQSLQITNHLFNIHYFLCSNFHRIIPHKLSKLIQEEMDSLKNPEPIRKFEFVVKSLPIT